MNLYQKYFVILTSGKVNLTTDNLPGKRKKQILKEAINTEQSNVKS